MSVKAHSIDVSEEAGVRYLHFGSSWIQGAMRIARPWSLELAYTREMMAALLFHHEPAWPAKVLIVGMGAASLPKFIYRNLPQSHMTIVEIQPGVVAAARQFFKLPDDPARLAVVIGDGADFVVEDSERYDLILSDGFGPDARPGRLDSADFYAACRERLADNGLFVCNLLGRSRGFQASIGRIREAFHRRAIVFPSGDSGNAVAFAAVGDRIELTPDEARERARWLKTTMGLDLLSTVSRLQLAVPAAGGCWAL
ncbi:MAG: fused MFS/spermidine synthase [Betaproteobacteria bacterium]